METYAARNYENLINIEFALIKADDKFVIADRF